MVREFGAWLGDTNPTIREPFLNMLPRLALAVAGLVTKGVKEVLQTIDDAHSSEHCQTVMTCLDSDTSITAPIVSGICRIGRDALKWNQMDVLECIGNFVQVEDISENFYTQRVIPVLAKLSETCSGLFSLCSCRMCEFDCARYIKCE